MVIGNKNLGNYFAELLIISSELYNMCSGKLKALSELDFDLDSL